MEPLPEKDDDDIKEEPKKSGNNNHNINSAPILISPRNTEKTKSVKEKPKNSSLRSSTESMYAEAILNLKASTSSSDRDKLKTALSTIKLYIDNIVKDPKNEKFRNINKNFKAFREKINIVPGVTGLLHLIGFNEIDEQTLALPEPDETGVKNLEFLSAELAKHTTSEPEPKKIVFDAGEGELIDSNFTLDVGLGKRVPVLPLIRGRHWKAINTAVTIPLIQSSSDLRHIPVVTFGHVFPPRVSYIRKEALGYIGKKVEDLERIALENLKELKYSWRANEFQVNEVKLPTLVCNESFSVEKVLDPEFLLEAEAILLSAQSSIFHQSLNDRSMALIIPCMGALIAMRFDMKLIPYLRGLAQALYDDADESHKLTTSVFTVMAGRIIGRCAFKDETEEDLENLVLSD